MKARRSGGKPVLPKRICRDQHTKYCTGPLGHRGCCNCFEYNHGHWLGLDCQPYLLEGAREWWQQS